MEPTVHETVTQPSPSSPGRDKLNNDGEANSSAATPALTTTTTPPSTLAAARTERNSVVPPYWRKHDRNGSRLSSYSASDNGHPTPIGLEDHTDEDSEQCKVLWAKSVTIDDYVVVSGTAPGLGAYVVWNCTVETLDGGPMKIRKRYSEFEDLRAKLAQTFPHAVGSMPQFPPKSVISRFRPRFLEKRKQGLSFFLNCVLLNPEFAGSPVLKDFLFS